MQKENQFKHKIIGLKLLNEKLKGLDIIFDYNEDKDGHVLGMLEGVKKMNQSNKKITNQDIMNSIMFLKKDMDKKFEDIDKRFDAVEKDIVDMKKDIDKRFDKIEKRLEKVESKIDLIIACPTIQSEIDHSALAKITLNQ